MPAHISNLLKDRVLLVVDNIFLALLFVNGGAINDDCRYKMISNFFDCDLDSVNRNHQSPLETIGIDEFTFAKIHFLSLTLTNFDDIPISLHSKLLSSDPRKSQTFCLLRIFFDTIDDFPECFWSTPTVTFDAESSDSPQTVVSDPQPRLLEDSLYIHTVVVFCTFVNTLPPSLFTLCEYYMLEFLLISQSITTHTLIIDFWCCIGKSLTNHELYRQVQLISEIIPKLSNTPSIRHRLQRLSGRLIQFLDPEQAAKTSEEVLLFLPDKDATLVDNDETEIQTKRRMSSYTQMCLWINIYVQNIQKLSADEIFALAIKNLLSMCKNDDGVVVQTNSLNLTHTALEFSKSCLDSLIGLQPSSPEFRKIFVAIKNVLGLLANTRTLPVEEVQETLRLVNLWISSPALRRFACCFNVFDLVENCADAFLLSDDKQSLISICEKLFQSTHWLINHEATALIANLGVVQLVAPERRESIKRSTNHLPSHFNNEPMTEMEFWRFNGSSEVRKPSKLMVMRNLLNYEPTSFSRIVHSMLSKIEDSKKNFVTQEEDCLSGSDKVISNNEDDKDKSPLSRVGDFFKSALGYVGIVEMPGKEQGEALSRKCSEPSEETVRRYENPSYIRGNKDVIVGSIKGRVGKIVGNEEIEESGKRQQARGSHEVVNAKLRDQRDDIYLRWLGVSTKVFSLGNYRRKVLGTASNLPPGFFSPGNKESAKVRHEIAVECLNSMIEWLKDEGGQVGIFDASNTTEERRKGVHDILIAHGIQVSGRMTDDAMHRYIGWDPEEAVKDYWTGESYNETSSKADADLIPSGIQYAHKLKNFLLSLREKEKKERKEQGWSDDERTLTIWTSARQSSVQMVKPFKEGGYSVKQRTLLAELNLGEIDSLTDEEIKKKFPEEYERHQKDMYHHRYPMAESYHDLAVRLESTILELEHERNDVLIIAHETVLKCLYAYLFDRPEDEIPRIVIPRNYLIEIIPSAYGCRETRMEIIDSLNNPVPVLTAELPVNIDK
ncbi:15647_t:CDS:10 [Acaulospora colombiana]|uniref:15647_t:CDS:1 n=1 Tax=Acaulospora colombiana TaxID=27376 RepID=A0ACA9K7D8_9GLOM|nr:15647_t:CDS:10 [Acaulospora colombiana]